VITAAIICNTDENVISTVKVFEALKSALAAIHPNRKFLISRARRAAGQTLGPRAVSWRHW